MRKKLPIILLTVAILIGSIRSTAAMAAIKEFEIDPDVYSLWVEEVPEGIYDSNYIAAKLNKTNLDPENYTLSLIDDVESLDTIQKAMKGAGVDPDRNRSFAMDVILYEYDEDEGDYYASKDSTVDVICPIPDNMYQYDEEDEPYLTESALKVVSVNSSGKLTYPTFDLVSVDDIICARFQMTGSTPYGFILNGIAPTPSEEDETEAPTQVPTKAPTQAPTKAPTQAPTKAPTQTPTKAPTATPKPQTPVKDKTPQTGDNHNSELLLAMGSLSAVTLLAVIITLKKMK